MCMIIFTNMHGKIHMYVHMCYITFPKEYIELFTPACNDGDLRLVDGNTTREGRVEICFDNVYGTVCDDQWGPLDAAVACRQLGFSDAGMFSYFLPPVVPAHCSLVKYSHFVF